MKHLHVLVFQYRFFSTNKDNIKNWVMKSINAHVTKFDPACVFDFIDAFLKQKEENKEAGLTDSAINGNFVFACLLRIPIYQKRRYIDILVLIMLTGKIVTLSITRRHFGTIPS